MKFNLLIAAIGCGMIAPGLASATRGTYRQQMGNTSVQHHQTRSAPAPCRSCNTTYGTPKRPSVQNTASNKSWICSVCPREYISTPEMWPEIQKATGTDMGDLIFINYHGIGATEICGARGLLRGPCGDVPSVYRYLTEECKYTFQPCSLSECDRRFGWCCNATTTAAADPDDEDDLEAQQNEETNGEAEAIEDEADPDDEEAVEDGADPHSCGRQSPQPHECFNPGMWMRRCKRVTLCQHVSCQDCKAPLQMNFEDWTGAETFLASTPGASYATSHYMGFNVHNAYAKESTDCTNPSTETGVISRFVGLLHKMVYETPFVIYRCREFTAKLFFITWVWNGSLTPPASVETLKVKVKGYKKFGGHFHSTFHLCYQQPFCFAPPHGFHGLKSIKVDLDSSDSGLVDQWICIDNVVLCA